MTAAASEVSLGPLSLVPPGQGRTFEVEGRRVAVFHTRAGRVFATQAACPHKNGPLADGLVGGTTVVCPLHSWTFNLSTGEPVMGSCKLETYSVRLDEQNRIILLLESPATHGSHSPEAGQ